MKFSPAIFRSTIAATLIAVLSPSCRTVQGPSGISYPPLMNAEKAPPGRKISRSLKVLEFSDIIAPLAIPERTSGVWRSSTMPENLGESVQTATVRHLKHSGLFQNGVDSSGSADLVLRGKISQFIATGHVNHAAEKKFATGGIGGAPGSALAGVATQNETARVFSRVELIDLTIIESATGQVVWSRERIVSESNMPNAHYLQSDSDILNRRVG